MADDAWLSLGDKDAGRKGGRRGVHSIVNSSYRVFESHLHDTCELRAGLDQASAQHSKFV